MVRFGLLSILRPRNGEFALADASDTAIGTSSRRSFPSTTSGCSRRTVLASLSPYLLPCYICSFNGYLPRFSAMRGHIGSDPKCHQRGTDMCKSISPGLARALSLLQLSTSNASHTLQLYRRKAVPTAVTTGLDIGMSNLSLRTITLSFYSELHDSIVKT